MLHNSIRLLNKTCRLPPRQLYQLVAFEQQQNQHLDKKREYSTAGIMEKFDLPQRLQGSAPSVWYEFKIILYCLSY